MSHALVVLAVSEDAGVSSLIRKFLDSEGHRAVCVSSSLEAIKMIAEGLSPDFLLLDVLKSRSADHLFAPALLEKIDSDRVCVLTDIGDSSWKPLASKWGIQKVLTKPLLRRDVERLLFEPVSAPAETMQACSAANGPNGAVHCEELDNNKFFFAASPAMLKIYRDVRLLAPVDIPVLILGESGVGKEIIAMLLHKYNPRSEKKFVNVNCAALPSELLESELFGYEAGAFTGAVKAKPGKFELAHKGTLLLDEIGEMSPQMQAKLLHVLQDGSFSRLGARSSTQVDVRVLAATNIHMEDAIAEKSFREDLYYRLNAFTITVPPLRERREEIPMMMDQLLQRNAADLGQQAFPISEKLKEAAQDYSWPGNLRELRNFITRTLVLQDQEAAYNDLRARTRLGAGTVKAQFATNEMANTTSHGMRNVVNSIKNQAEIRMIQDALTASGWNRRRAASNLNISYRALLYKIQQHGLMTS
ncbi:MAG TPA: sigma-54 dependent transcriptional regulator [Alloacidobacterium sp.]|jgi:two-component system response regulator AtoC|nr:sigma-54 dependent transcriptional regulator [Alloacidobacterium sp.]